ncbi:MAG: pectate lyase [Bacteroidales bacterium]|nr:pectate lyase [Candidatus Liminaster caballi]
MKQLALTLSVAACLSFTAKAELNIQTVGGWFESGYVEWTNIEGAASYDVYCQPVGGEYVKLDAPLVRDYGTYGRADVVGIKAGSYSFKIVPLDADGNEIGAETTFTDTFTAVAHDRGGFAHFKTASSTFNPSKGIGAYKNDGTLKDNAKVFYVTADNAKTITTKVKTSNSASTDCVGIQSIIDAYQKGLDTTPICFRIVGTVSKDDLDHISSSAEGLQIKGKGAYSELNITIEGIGNDATVHGFGFLLRNACSVELRNFAIMWCMDDAVSMDTDNSNLWIHNLDLFYGKPGSAADQKKGDGTLDIKGDSKYSTISYNHLWDSGKSSLCGMTSESGPNYLTYHHNWFDHSDSRHPRIRTMSVHVYNNYYDGNSKYGVGSTTGSDVFVENNYFRACKYPMLTSKQGSDVHNGVGSSDDTKGTFSGEEGGSIKAFGNFMTGQKSFEPYVEGDATYSKHFDAYVVESRDQQVPATVVSLLGGNTYSNFDTDASLMYQNYTCHAADSVPSIVKGQYGAGRCEHGDFTWTFGATEDANDAIITALSTAIQNYKTTLVGFYGQKIGDGGTQGGGDGGDTGGGDTGGGDTGGGDSTDPIDGEVVCHFLEKKPSSTMVTVSGNYSNSKGTVTYNGTSYNWCVKMESATAIDITPTSNAEITLVFGPSETSKKLYLDSKAYTTDSNGKYKFTATAGTTYKLTKGDSINLFLIIFHADGESSICVLPVGNEDNAPVITDLQGRVVKTVTMGQFYLINGQKVLIK